MRVKDIIDPKLSDLLFEKFQADWRKTKFWDGYTCPITGQVKVKKPNLD